MADRDDLIVVRDGPRVYRVYWYLADVQDVGACLGENPRYTDAATRAAQECSPEKDHDGFYWATERAAKAACKAAIQAHQGQPWPTWAIRAHEAGWKPPKGWTP